MTGEERASFLPRDTVSARGLTARSAPPAPFAFLAPTTSERATLCLGLACFRGVSPRALKRLIDMQRLAKVNTLTLFYLLTCSLLQRLLQVLACCQKKAQPRIRAASDLHPAFRAPCTIMLAPPTPTDAM